MKLGGKMRNTMFFDDRRNLLAVRTANSLAEVADFEGRKYSTQFLEKHDFYRGDYYSPYYDYLVQEISE